MNHEPWADPGVDALVAMTATATTDSAAFEDFQNSHAPSAEQEQLTELLRLVLTSTDLSDADKEQAATEIDGISAEVADGGKSLATVEKKLTAVQRIVAKAADIAEPALAVSARLIEMF